MAIKTDKADYAYTTISGSWQMGRYTYDVWAYRPNGVGRLLGSRRAWVDAVALARSYAPVKERA